MRVKKYLLAGLWVFILSGGLTSLLWAIKAGFWGGLQFGILFGTGLTLIFGLLIVPLDYSFTKGLSSSELNIKQHGEIKIMGHAEDVFQRSVQILSGLKIIKSIQRSQDKMAVTATTKISLYSCGEKIRLVFVALEKGEVIIKINSEPLFGYTLIDYGKNLRNVQLISAALAEGEAAMESN
jgi:hypothetical protein